MLFQFLFDHECYMSHKTWTVFCKYPLAMAFRAQERDRKKRNGERYWNIDETGQFQPDYSEHAEGDEVTNYAQDEDVVMLRAVVPAGSDTQTQKEKGATIWYSKGGSDGTEEQTEHPADESENAPNADAIEGCFSETEALGDLDDQDPMAEDDTQICLSGRVRQWDCWLLRGQREPLRSMGLYHYGMFVYNHTMVDSFTPDFATYYFDDLHPFCAQQIQKLRCDEAYLVPRLFGVNLPTRQDDKGKEINALMKTMLFRPMNLPAGLSAYDDEHVYDMISKFLDANASFISSWEEWFWQTTPIG